MRLTTATINGLIAQIHDESLCERIQKEVNKLAKQKKFASIFEDNIQKCIPLYDIPLKRGALVALKGCQVVLRRC
jgi:adenine-specific DNA-methyltransferase